MDLEKLARYMIWANDIARDLLEELAEEEFSRDVLPPFGSIRSLCAHIMLAIEYNIETRVKKREIDPYELDERYHNMPKEALLARWREVDGELLDYARVETDEAYTFPNFLGDGEIRVPRDDFFMQYLLHTTHHRAQVMSALRAMGKEARTTDYLFYLSDTAKA